MKKLKFLFNTYFYFDMFILDLCKYKQYQKLIECPPKGNMFKLPESLIPTSKYEQNKHFYYIQIFTTTISNHTIFIKKIYTQDIKVTYNENFILSYFYVPNDLINLKKSCDYYFRSLLCFDTKEKAEKELQFLTTKLNNHKIIIKGSFDNCLYGYYKRL